MVAYVIFRKHSSDHKLPFSQRFEGSSLHTEPNPNFLTWLLKPRTLTRSNISKGRRFPGTHVIPKVIKSNKNIKHLLVVRDKKESNTVLTSRSSLLPGTQANPKREAYCIPLLIPTHSSTRLSPTHCWQESSPPAIQENA